MERIKHVLFESPDIRILFVTAVYFSSAYLGLLLAFHEPLSSPVWPPVGVGFALIIFLGTRTWPGIAIGSLLAYMLVFIINDLEINLITIVSISIITIGNTFEILIGRFLYKRFITSEDPFTKTNETFVFLFIALVMCLVGSSLGTYSLYINGSITGQNVIQNWIYWWIPNVASVLLFTPFILSWKRSFRFSMNRRNSVEILVFIVISLLFVFILNIDQLRPAIEQSIPFFILPVLLWCAFRFNLQITMAGILLTSLSAIYFTVNGMGPFVLQSNENSILILQIFIGVVSISSIVLSSTVYERSLAEETIRKFNETLESKIKERTKELDDEISIRKKAEITLQDTNKQLRKANVELDNFVYKVSHDLRAPIASVLGLVNLAKRETKMHNLMEFFDMIGKSAEQQDIFIKDILDISRNSRLIVDKNKIQWEGLINDTIDNLKYSRKEKEFHKVIRVEGKTDFFSDQRRLKVILNNLISNAIRYANGKTPKVEINVKVNSNYADISISDNGIGIAKQHHKKIFNMFYRATDNNVGSGLGLYIVKESVDRLKGKINFESTVGKGTKFFLHIPNLLNGESTENKSQST